MFQELLLAKNKTIVDTALKYFYQRLNISTEEQKKINIEVVKRLAGADGTCKGNYDWKKNKLLSIDIKIKHHSSVYGMLDSLAHELVHAKQHLRGDFGFTYIEVPFLFFFKIERVVKTFKDQIMHDVDYFDQLCEREAFTTGYLLMRDFFKMLYSTETESTNDCEKECNMNEQEKRDEYPRDYDLEFIDPHDDVDHITTDKEEE